jgi:CRISPR-associated protein Cmr1
VPRPEPTVQLPSLATKSDKGTITQVREYRLITPLFGGGVQPAEADPVSTIRASSVRGQLRFWWRATRGGQFNGDLVAMKTAEDLLWGAPARFDKQGTIVSRPSQVQVIVNATDTGEQFTVKDPRTGRLLTNREGQPLSAGAPQSPYSYGAFPLNDKPGAMLRENVRFRLTITFPTDVKRDVEAALWAWETFGGLGARTRRGFGAISCERIDGAVAEQPPAEQQGTMAWLLERLRIYVLPGRAPERVPQLSAEPMLYVSVPGSDAIDIWRERLLDRLKAFRQQRPLNRFQEAGKTITRPGRNRWPEQDEVRRLTRRRLLPRHGTIISPLQRFPRAAFGLPLIIQYKRDDQRAGDPWGNNTVNVPGKERFASPLIMRPIACVKGFVAVAIVLENTRVPASAVLTTQNGEFPIRTDLTEAEARQVMRHDDRTPLLGDNTDVLDAFLNFLKER